MAENNPGATIDTVIVLNSNPSALHTLLVNNSNFEIVNNKLKLKSGITLDYEQTPKVAITITAQEQGSGKTYSEKCTITVVNVNEPPIAITLSNSSVSEDSAGASIGTVTVDDPEGNNNHTVTVDDSRFEVTGYVLKLKSGQSLDYESTPQVVLELTTVDPGGLQLKQSKTITVTDVNEPPTAITLSNSSVVEDSAGASIGTLTVTDPEGNNNHTVTVDDSRFEVTNYVLKLKSGQRLDYETTPQVVLELVAVDTGGLQLKQNKTITVTDVNEAPVISGIPSQKITEKESFIPITLDDYVSDPEDPDSNLAWKCFGLKYLTATIDKRTAKITRPDTAWCGTDTATFCVSDTGGLSDSTTVVFICEAVNDTPTNILLSNVSVKEHDTAAIVGTITVVDPDSQDTHTITVDDSRFVVDKKVLRLAVGVWLNYESDSAIAITISATDNGNLTIKRSFAIHAEDINEAPYDIKIGSTTVEEKKHGALVGGVSVSECDLNDTQSFVLDDSRFEVVKCILKLKDTAVVYFSNEQTIPLSIQAIDKGGLSITRQFTFVVMPATQIVNTTGQSKKGAPIVSLFPSIVSVDKDKSVMFLFTMQQAGACMWDVYDNQAHCLFSGSEKWTQGQHRVFWNLVNRDGKKASSGVYMVKVRVVANGKKSAEQRLLFGIKQ